MRGSLRQRQPGTWELRVELPRDPVSGRRRQVSRSHTGTKRTAQRALNDLLASIGAGGHRPTDSRLDDLFSRWLDQSREDLSPTTLRRYQGLIRQHISPALGHRPLHTIKASDLDALYLALTRQAKLAPATVRQVHAVLRRSLSQALRWGWITANPALNASPPRLRRSTINPPSPEQVVGLLGLAASAEPDFGCFLRLAATTGARRGELCALRWTDYDSTNRVLTISRNVIEVAGGVIEKDTKTHAARRVTLDAETAAGLDDHRRRMTARAAQADLIARADAFVFSLDPDCARPWLPDRVTKTFERFRSQAGLPRMRLHDLRHFAATRLLTAGIDVRTVAGRLGHANASTTLGVYAHFLEQADSNAADVMGGLLSVHEAAHRR